MKRILLLGKSHVVAPYRAWKNQRAENFANIHCDALGIGEKQGGLGGILLAGSKIISPHPNEMPTFFFSSKSNGECFDLNEYDFVVFLAGFNPLDPRFWSPGDGIPLLSESILQAMIDNHPPLAMCTQLKSSLGSRLLLAFNPLPKDGFPSFKTLIESPKKREIIRRNIKCIRRICSEAPLSAITPRYILPGEEVLCGTGIQTNAKYMSSNPQDFQHANTKYGSYILKACINMSRA